MLTSESEKEVIRSSTRRGILPLSVVLMGEVSGKGSVWFLGRLTRSSESEYEVLDTLVTYVTCWGEPGVRGSGETDRPRLEYGVEVTGGMSPPSGPPGYPPE